MQETKKEKKVLIVDDDVTLREMLSEEFSRRKINVITAKNATEGFDMIANEKPDAAIVDIMMPGPSGIDLINEVRKVPELKDTFFMILTDSSKSKDVADAMENKVTVFLQKASVDPATIAKIIEDHFKTVCETCV